MFKVGDTVSFGACEVGYPLWDMDWRREADWAICTEAAVPRVGETATTWKPAPGRGCQPWRQTSQPSSPSAEPSRAA